MRLATVRQNGHLQAARIEGAKATLLDFADVGAVLRSGDDWRTVAASASDKEVPAASLNFAPLVVHPSKIICVGLNYRHHIEEMGESPPEYPTLFAKFAGSLIGAGDPIRLPRVSEQVDWEVELVAVIGSSIRYATATEAGRAIAGFTVGNDVSVRDFQRRTSQWLQGKTFDSSTPVGPYLVTTDEIGMAPDLEIRCEVDGVVRQRARTCDLLFGAADLAAYVSQIITLEPGDLIFTGTPGGVGQGHKPPVFLRSGESVASVIEGIGAMLNPCVPDTER